MFKYKYKKETDIEVSGINHYLYMVDSIVITSLYGNYRFSGSVDKKRDGVQFRSWRIQDTELFVNCGKIRRHDG